MQDEYWDRLQEIFFAAVALDPVARAAYLIQACHGDDSLRERIESLLQSHEQQHLFVDSPAYQAAAEMLVQDHHFRVGISSLITKSSRCWDKAAWARSILQRIQN